MRLSRARSRLECPSCRVQAWKGKVTSCPNCGHAYVIPVKQLLAGSPGLQVAQQRLD